MCVCVYVRVGLLTGRQVRDGESGLPKIYCQHLLLLLLLLSLVSEQLAQPDCRFTSTTTFPDTAICAPPSQLRLADGHRPPSPDGLNEGRKE